MSATQCPWAMIDPHDHAGMSEQSSTADDDQSARLSARRRTDAHQWPRARAEPAYLRDFERGVRLLLGRGRRRNIDGKHR